LVYKSGSDDITRVEKVFQEKIDQRTSLQRYAKTPKRKEFSTIPI
jgi:preprotein translocase subunit Sss1